MLIILNLILSFAFAFDMKPLPTPGPMKCEKAVLIYPELLGEYSKKEEAQFCFDSAFVNIVSKNCEFGCGLVKKAKADKEPLVYKTAGTPGAWLCDSYGGTPRVLFLEYKGVKHKQSFCILGQEIVSAPYLLSAKGK